VTIGPGVFEIRIHSVLEYRMIVVSKFREAIYVLHVFVKRTPKTARRDVEHARQRYRVLLRERSQK
jgi:phage-related protein